MICKEYGQQNKNVIILLHGGGLSWWNYIDEIEVLKKDFHLIIPILDGHFGSDKNFISIQDNAFEIINFIEKNYGGKVKLIAGLSLGGQILLEILSKKDNICEYAIIESALSIPMKITYNIIKPCMNLFYNLIKKKWFSKLQFNSLKIRNDLFEYYYKTTINITKSNLIAFMKANSNYKINKSLSKSNAKALIVVGSKERPIMKKSAENILKLLPNSRLEILDGYYHGELSINHGFEYVEKINNLISN